MTKQLTYLAGILSIALGATLTSCLSKGTVVRADAYEAQTVAEQKEQAEQEAPSSTPARPKGQTRPQKQTTPLDGEWTIVKVGKTPISQDEDMPYMIFSDNEGRFYASNGCNIINGDYSYADHAVTLSSTVSTLRDCPDLDYPDKISKVLREGERLQTRIEDKGRETYLYLSDGGGSNVLTLRRHNMETINGEWEVAYIGSEEVDGSEIDLFFDIPEHKVHGNTGCNFFNGAIVIDPHRESAISFTHLGVTMKYCDNADTERKLLVAMEETEGYTLRDATTLYLNDASGRRLLTLKRR